MSILFYSPLQIRELFHLEFLRSLARKMKPGDYALKGGVNLRFFFGSPRYSEDMDLDVRGIGVETLRDTVMTILAGASFRETLASFGMRSIVPPDIRKAKQTETTQRFKIHLITTAGDNLFTKIEFSRRGMDEGIRIESIRAEILRAHHLPPLICPHYDGVTAALQKIGALAGRRSIQARDVFDLYLLTTVTEMPRPLTAVTGRAEIFRKAIENIYMIDFRQFNDTVLMYFQPEDRLLYEDPSRWDEIRLSVSARIEELL